MHTNIEFSLFTSNKAISISKLKKNEIFFSLMFQQNTETILRQSLKGGLKR